MKVSFTYLDGEGVERRYVDLGTYDLPMPPREGDHIDITLDDGSEVDGYVSSAYLSIDARTGEATARVYLR